MVELLSYKIIFYLCLDHQILSEFSSPKIEQETPFLNGSNFAAVWNTLTLSNNSTSTEYLYETDETEQLHCQTTEFIESAISISNLLTVVNSAANFLIYMLKGKKFRDLFLQTYFRKCFRNSREISYRANGKCFMY